MKIPTPFLILIMVTFFVACFFVRAPQVFSVQPPSVTSISPSSGPTAGGTNVNIVGTGFDSGTVTIGGASATNVTVVSATQITAITPAGTVGARDVVFTRTSDGKSDTLTGGFTYVAPHTITASADAHGSISPSGAVSVNDGDSQSFTITPDANYHIADVLVDNVSVGAVTSYNFTNVVANHTIAATFIFIPDTIAPVAVANLALSNPSNSAITVSWTAPGDDNNTGTATTYDLRYSTSNITDVNWSSATQVSNEPSPSAAGSSESKTVSGLSATTTYYFAIKTSDEIPNESDLSNVPSLATLAEGEGEPDCGDGNLDEGEECDDGNTEGGDGCSAVCVIETEEPGEPGEPGEEPPSYLGGVLIRTFKVVLSGQAYPGSKIEVFRRTIGDIESSRQVIPLETHEALEDGTFDLSLGLLLAQEMFFALRVEDKDGRKTDIIGFDVDLETENTLEARDILVPPTIGFEKTVVTREGKINVLGYAAPNSVVEIEVDDSTSEKTESNNEGFWAFEMAAFDLNPGEHYLKVRQINQSGKESLFSSPKSFRISLLKFPWVDFNGDEVINITDWSVFLFRWGHNDENVKSTIDLNNDDKINIYDFSVFLNAMTL